jgi:hypothetical protein
VAAEGLTAVGERVFYELFQRGNLNKSTPDKGLAEALQPAIPDPSVKG